MKLSDTFDILITNGNPKIPEEARLLLGSVVMALHIVQVDPRSVLEQVEMVLDGHKHSAQDPQSTIGLKQAVQTLRTHLPSSPTPSSHS